MNKAAIENYLSIASKTFQKKRKDSTTEIYVGDEEPEACGIVVDNPLFEFILDRRFLAYGRCYLSYGKKGSAKTSTFFEYAKYFQKIGGLVVWIETENAIDKDYAKDQGVDLEKMIITHPSTLEDALEVAKSFIFNMPVAFPDGDTPVLICLDSIAGTITDYEDDKDILGQNKPGEHAKILADFYSRICKPLANEKCIFLCLNQLKEAIGGVPSFTGEPQEAMKGGQAPRFHSTYQFKYSKIKDMTEEEEHSKAERKIGSIHRIQVTRNKLGREGKGQEITIPLYRKGGYDWWTPLVEKLGKEYPAIMKNPQGYYKWVATDTKWTDPSDGIEKIINAEQSMRPREMANIIANSAEAREIIRNAFEIRPLPSQEQVEAIEKEIKSKRSKKKVEEKEL